MMNIFGSYYDNNWVITVIPRKRHRPWQYEAEGNDHLLSSPGAADIGGLFITPLEKVSKRSTRSFCEMFTNKYASATGT